MSRWAVLGLLVLCTGVPAQVADTRYEYFVQEVGPFTRVLLGPTMASPTLPKVRAALSDCKVPYVHPRTLDALNLFSAGVVPEGFVHHMANMSSVQAEWIACVIERI